MGASVLVGAVIVLVGAWRICSWRARDKPLLPPAWLSYVRGIADAVAWASGGLLFLLIGLGVSGGGLQIFLWGALLSGSMAFLAGRQLASIRKENLGSLAALVSLRMRRGWSTFRSATLRAAGIVSPEGPTDIRISFDLLDRLADVRVFVRLYGLGLIIVPVVVSLSIAWGLNTGTGLASRALRILVGYNALAVVSCLTAAIIGTVVLQALLRILGILQYRSDLQRMFKVVVAWTGHGTAAGFVAAALLPVSARLLPSAAAPPGTTSVAVLTPQMLVDIPAACAIVGYAIGIIAAVVEDGAYARNLVVRRTIAPMIFFFVVCFLLEHGFSPKSFIESVAEQAVAARETCLAVELESHLQDPGWVLQALGACGTQTYVDNGLVLWSVGIGLFAASLVAFIRDFRARSVSDV